jgi:hypothetical protein
VSIGIGLEYLLESVADGNTIVDSVMDMMMNNDLGKNLLLEYGNKCDN